MFRLRLALVDHSPETEKLQYSAEREIGLRRHADTRARRLALLRSYRH
jgi:hypothetical protein